MLRSTGAYLSKNPQTTSPSRSLKGGNNSENDQTHLRDSKLAKCKLTSMVGKSNIKNVVEKGYVMQIINKLLKVPSNYLCLFQFYHTFNHKFTILPTFCSPLLLASQAKVTGVASPLVQLVDGERQCYGSDQKSEQDHRITPGNR